MTNTSAVFGQVRETDRTDMKHENGRLNSAPTSHLRVRRGEFPKPWSARIPPTSSRRGHLLSDTPLFITLWGEISLLRSHVSCKTIQPSEPNLHIISEFENHFRLLLCQEKLSQCHLPSAEYYLVMPLLKLHVFIYDISHQLKGQVACGATSISVFLSFPLFSFLLLPLSCFLSSDKTLSDPGCFYWRVKTTLSISNVSHMLCWHCL